MVTQIEILKVNVEHVIFDKRRYSLEDITDQLEMPIYNTAQLDDVLDTTRITLLNKNKRPLKPFTRIIIRTYDTVNNETMPMVLYRYVDNDTVTNTALGSSPIYKHTVNLIEITKILERRVVDNHCFTNFLPYNYGISKHEIEYTVDKSLCTTKWQSMGTMIGEYTAKRFTYHEYNSDLRFVGPNILLDANTGTYTISTAVNLRVKGVYTYDDGSNPLYTLTVINWGLFGGGEVEVNIPLTKYYITKPDGTRTNLNNSANSTYTFIQTGYHRITQVYSYSVSGTDIFYYEVHWDFFVVASEKHALHEYTIKEVIDRVLRTSSVLANGIDEPEFILDPNLNEYLSGIQSPEFSLTQCTLYEAMSHIGKYIHAIPRLIPNVYSDIKIDSSGQKITFDNDYAKWNVVTFDFLGNRENGYFFQGNSALLYNNRFVGSNYSIIDLENPSEEFVQDFVSNIQNATVTNYEGGYTVIEPYKDGYVTTRTESSNFEISDNECIIKTRLPIRSIISVKLRVEGDNNKVIDITSRVCEKKVYDLKEDYNSSDYSKQKSHFLYYTEKNNNLYGCDYVRPNRSSYDSFANVQSIKAILRWGGLSNWNGNLCDIECQVEYIPYLTFKARQYKTFVDPTAEKSTLFFNQQANEIDVEAYGENMNSTLLKTGNIKVSKTQYFDNLQDTPFCGQWHVSEYFAFQVNTEIARNTPIKCTSIWSKYYNELFADVSIKKDVRQFEISEKESVSRDIDIEEFCIIDTRLDVDIVYSSSSLTSMQEWVEKELLSVGFGTESTLSAIAKKLHNDNHDFTNITSAICSTESTDKDGNTEWHDFLIPVACFPFGRSVVVQFAFDDSYSAATHTINASNYGGASTYALENYIKYTNDYGRFNNLYFELIDKISSSDISGVALSKQLYKLDLDNQVITPNSVYGYFGGGVIDGQSMGYCIDKDNREQIRGTAQLNFITHNHKIEIFKGLIETLPLVGDNKTKYKFVVFQEKQNKLGDFVTGRYIQQNMPTIQYSNKTKHIKIGSVTASSSQQSGGGNITPFVAVLSSTPSDTLLGEGYGIITEEGKLCLYVEKKIRSGDTLPPIYLMFRRKI